MPSHRVGDTVHVKPETDERYAGTYTVTKKNRTSYFLKNEDGRNVRAPRSAVHAGPLKD